jgi:methylenetetrahydrofolate dehydrogenase (NADP+)/methenyltetrahydrofolate cyclohydrolase
MILLDGNTVSQKRLALLKEKVSASNSKPGLAVIRVGENPASKVYVAKKVKTCKEIGFYSLEKILPETVSEKELLDLIKTLNADSKIHGILVQLPLPKQISESAVIEAIDPKKDVDGFHPMNLGLLTAQQEGFVPCTPLGIMTLLNDYKIEISGKRAVVAGRSRIVGRPISLLLDHAGATVTVVHSKTKNPSSIYKQAEILIAAIGKPHHIRAEDLSPGVVVVDVGINRLSDGKLAGDVDFANVSKIASAISPVPGGVGPMTICTLLENTWKSFQRLK